GVDIYKFVGGALADQRNFVDNSTEFNVSRWAVGMFYSGRNTIESARIVNAQAGFIDNIEASEDNQYLNSTVVGGITGYAVGDQGSYLIDGGFYINLHDIASQIPLSANRNLTIGKLQFGTYSGSDTRYHYFLNPGIERLTQRDHSLIGGIGWTNLF